MVAYPETAEQPLDPVNLYCVFGFVLVPVVLVVAVEHVYNELRHIQVLLAALRAQQPPG